MEDERKAEMFPLDGPQNPDPFASRLEDLAREAENDEALVEGVRALIESESQGTGTSKGGSRISYGEAGRPPVAADTKFRARFQPVEEPEERGVAVRPGPGASFNPEAGYGHEHG